MAQVERADDGPPVVTATLKEGASISGSSVGDDTFDAIESLMLESYRERGGELYALQTTREDYTDLFSSIEIWIQGDKAEMISYPNLPRGFRDKGSVTRYQRRTLTAAELTSFRAFLEERSVDSWEKAVDTSDHDASSFQYLHLTPSLGRRVAATFTPSSEKGEGTKYEELTALFQGLANVPADTIFPSIAELPGARVLVDHVRADTIYADSEGLKMRHVADDLVVDWNLLGPQGMGEPAQVPEYQVQSDDTFAKRPLQSAGEGHLWVARSSPTGTDVGTLDQKTSRFELKAHFDTLRFDSSQMWVVGDMVYVAMDEVLLLPLGRAASP